MKIYIDSGFHCYATNTEGNLREVETDFFIGKCAEFIEGYMFVPAGESWIREDRMVFKGEMVTPWRPYEELEQIQREYERAQLADMRAALELLGVMMDE